MYNTLRVVEVDNAVEKFETRSPEDLELGTTWEDEYGDVYVVVSSGPGFEPWAFVRLISAPDTHTRIGVLYNHDMDLTPVEVGLALL